MSKAELLVFWRVAVGLLFAQSAAGKLRGLRDFEVTVRDFALLPAAWSGVTARALVALEALVALLLAAGGGAAPLLVAGFLMAFALLALFSAALVSVLRRDVAVSCNCFGPSDRRVSWYDVARNATVAGGCAWGAALAGADPPAPGTSAVLLLAAMAAVGVALTLHLREVVQTALRPF